MQRQTRQRQAIRDAFTTAGRPLSPAEVQSLASPRTRRIGMATVYRSIRAMIESGELIEVDLPGEPSRYESAGKVHHHHFHCRTCKRVYEVEGCPEDLRALVPRGFSLEDHEVVLYGVCAACK